MTDLDGFYLSKSEPNTSCLLALRDVILDCDPNISETRKYGMPCFIYSGKILCYLWVDKKTDEPYMLFVEGKLLDHPKLEIGDRSKMKILRVQPDKDLPLEVINPILHEALKIYRVE